MDQLLAAAQSIEAAGWPAWIGFVILKGSVVFAAALLTSLLLGRAAGRHRYGVLGVAFAGVLLLPALPALLPALSVPQLGSLVHPGSVRSQSVQSLSDAPTTPFVQANVFMPTDARVATSGSMGGPTVAAPAGALSPAASSDVAGPARHRIDGTPSWLQDVPVGSLLVGVWLAGALLLLVSMAASLLASTRLERRAKRLLSPTWMTLLDRARADLGIRREIRLLLSDEVRVPMTAGLLRPMLLLPPEAAAWSEERRRVVLAHELMHVRRGDWILQILTRLTLALHWPDPLAWLALRRAESAREQACDDGVVALGTRPSVYAGHLLDIAAAAAVGRTSPVAALAMARRSQLEGRLLAILRDRGKTKPLTALWFLYPLGMAVVVVTVAAVEPGAPLQDATASISEGLAIASKDAAESDESAQVAPPESNSSSSSPGVSTVEDVQNVDEVDADAIWSRLRARGSRRSGFSGYTHNEIGPNGDEIIEQVGTWNGDLIIEKRFENGLRVALFAHDVELGPRLSLPERLDEGAFLEIESSAGSAVQSLVLAAGPDGQPVPIFRIDGQKRVFDEAGQRWRAAMMSVLSDIYEIASIRGQESSLRGEISSIRGEESSLRGEISSIRGEESSLRGEISSVRGEESSLRGEISSVRGEESSLRGEISSVHGEESSLRGEISGLRAELGELQRRRNHLNSGDSADRVKLEEVAAAIQRTERAIRDTQEQIRTLDVDGRIQEIEKQIVALDVAGQVREIERQIAALDVEGQVRDIRRRIAELDVDGKVRVIQEKIAKLDVAGKTRALQAQIEALRADERIRDLDGQLRENRGELKEAVDRLGH